MPTVAPLELNISSVALDGYLRSGNIPIPDTEDTEYLFDGIYLPSPTTLTAKAYWPDVRSKNVVQNWNSAYPGLEWEQPFYAYGMNGPVLYEIVQAPSGMGFVGGRMTRNPVTGFFDYQSAVLTWQNPVAGRYRIGVMATDQNGQKVYWIFDLFVDAARNFFMALNATGTGLGTSPSNYASWASTILGQTTESPSKNKVLRIKGDEYPERSQLRPDQNFTAASWVSMPAETPTFLQIFSLGSDNLHFHNVKFEGIGTDGFGVINGEGIQHRIGVWGVEFNECYKLGELNSNNACIGFNKSGNSFGRERIFVADSIFRNSSDLHGYDYYSVADNGFINNQLILTDGTTSLGSSWIFPKMMVKSSEIMFNKADIPTCVDPLGTEVLQIYNAWDVNHAISFDVDQRVEYNYVRTGGNPIVRSNGADNLSPSPSVVSNFFKRNTFAGGSVYANNYVSPRPNRLSFAEDNVILNSGGGIAVPGGATAWTKSGNIESTNLALVDVNGHIINADDKGQKGYGTWRPE